MHHAYTIFTGMFDSRRRLGSSYCLPLRDTFDGVSSCFWPYSMPLGCGNTVSSFLLLTCYCLESLFSSTLLLEKNKIGVREGDYNWNAGVTYKKFANWILSLVIIVTTIPMMIEKIISFGLVLFELKSHCSLW